MQTVYIKCLLFSGKKRLSIDTLGGRCNAIIGRVSVSIESIDQLSDQLSKEEGREGRRAGNGTDRQLEREGKGRR